MEYDPDKAFEDEEFDYYYLLEDTDDEREYYWTEFSYYLMTDRWNTQPEENFN